MSLSHERECVNVELGVDLVDAFACAAASSGVPVQKEEAIPTSEVHRSDETWEVLLDMWDKDNDLIGPIELAALECVVFQMGATSEGFLSA